MRRRRSEVSPVAAQSAELKFHRVAAMEAVEFGPGSGIWTAEDLAPFVSKVTTAFVWAEPPPGVDPAPVLEALRRVAVVKFVPAAPVDAVVSEDVVTAPLPVGATIRGIVVGMVAEAPVTGAERERLDVVIDEVLTEVRL